MVDITHKTNTLRMAMAQAIVTVSSADTIQAIKNDQIPKGNVFAMSKAAGLLGIKKTPELLPDCHPIPIEFADFKFEISDLEISILCSIKTIYKTGVEVEAMHGASVVALNMYDMLKPVDKGVEKKNIRLLEKKGGKSSWKDDFKEELTAAVIVCSDTIAAGQKEDRAGKAIIDKLKSYGVSISAYEVIPDEKSAIEDQLQKHHQSSKLIIFTGGRGLSSRDVTPDTLEPLVDRRIPGIEEAIRKYGQDRMPYAMLSRSLAGTYAKSLVLALPGSTNGAKGIHGRYFPFGASCIQDF